MRAIKKDPSSPGHASPPSLSLLHAALETRLSPPVSGTRSLTSAFLFCFVLGLLHGSGRLQCQLYPDGDCHLHQPGPAVVGAAHPGLLRGPIPDQSPPPLWSPYPLRWGLLQGWSREDHDGRQSSEHWQEGQGGTGEECFSTFWGGGLALVEMGSTVDRVKPLHRIHYISSNGNPGSKPFPSQARL